MAVGCDRGRPPGDVMSELPPKDMTSGLPPGHAVTGNPPALQLYTVRAQMAAGRQRPGDRVQLQGGRVAGHRVPRRQSARHVLRWQLAHHVPRRPPAITQPTAIKLVFETY